MIYLPTVLGRYSSGQRGQTVNLLFFNFAGSNPALPTSIQNLLLIFGFKRKKIPLEKFPMGFFYFKDLSSNLQPKPNHPW